MTRKDTKKKMTVEVTYKQHEWVEHLASDLRGTKSDVIQHLVQQQIDADESGDPSAFRLRKLFESMVKNQPVQRLNAAKALLHELEIMFEIADKEEEAKDYRRRLQEQRENYASKFGTPWPEEPED